MADKDDEALLGIKGFKDSKHYEQVRPDYPKEAVEILMNKLGLLGEYRDKAKQLTVLELGAGTGKFTRVMASVLHDANVRIIASDPVKEMCEQFKDMLPDIEIKQFGAENIEFIWETEQNGKFKRCSRGKCSCCGCSFMFSLV
ncbi:uncharacterized protein LOC110249963 isoform X3 [Exaiptasia diaphana]|uniref:Methyltransferase domain-containing protein n=1 Tax=Exaiptasia diaphana TaxID=2652724 RepID=A0A913XZD5_EXADI|nr:uncharacterized protein LOC110249963 isoform X3 [Exaiptasia diaphana]